jgi:chromate transporter
MLDPMLAGVLGSIVTTWVTFVPCFLWIFLGAPYIEYLRGNKALTTALSAITAAVVGVVLNLGVWFSLHALFGHVDELRWFGLRLFVPVWASVDLASLVLTAGACIALFRFHAGMVVTLLGSVVLGAGWYLLAVG